MDLRLFSQEMLKGLSKYCAEALQAAEYVTGSGESQPPTMGEKDPREAPTFRQDRKGNSGRKL